MSTEYTDARGGRAGGGRGEVNVFTSFRIKKRSHSLRWPGQACLAKLGLALGNP